MSRTLGPKLGLAFGAVSSLFLIALAVSLVFSGRSSPARSTRPQPGTGPWPSRRGRTLAG